MCPRCASDELEEWDWDYGRCSQTGYRDIGDGFRCKTCGLTGPMYEVVTNG